MTGNGKGLETKIALLNKEFGLFVLTLSNEDNEWQKLSKVSRLLLEQRELLRLESTFLSLVSVARGVPNAGDITITTELTPKNVILYLLEILRHLIDTLDPNNEQILRNVLELLIFILSLGPPLPPVDRYFDSGESAPRYENLIKNVQSPAQLFSTDEFLNSMSSDVTILCEQGTNLIGGLPWTDLALQACRLARGYDPLMRHFDTPVANLFRVPISRLSFGTPDPSHLELTLRLVAACPSLFIDLDEPPQPKLRSLLSLLERTHSHLSVCLAMTSCLYRLFVVSELTLDACLDDDIITPLMEQLAFMVRVYKGSEEQLLRMVFQLLKFMNRRQECKVIIAGQPSVVMECMSVIQECKFEAVLAVAFLNSIAAYLSLENTSCLVRAISHCSSNVFMPKEFENYFHSVSLQLLAMHSLDEQPSNTLGAEEFMKFSSHAIIGLADPSFMQLGLKVVHILFDYPGIQGIISKEFIIAFTKLFLESVRVDSEDMIGLFAFLLCNYVLQGASDAAVRAVKESDFVSHVLKLFTSEERVEYLCSFTQILKYTVASYERVGLEFNELKDRNIVEKLLGLLLGKYCINMEPGSKTSINIHSDIISILWTFSCDVSYCEDTFLRSLSVTKLVQVLDVQLADLSGLEANSYVFRGTAHILSNLSQKKETVKLEIAETGLASSLSLLLLDLTKRTPVPWIVLEVTLRLIDTITTDDIYKLQLMQEHKWVSLIVDIIKLEPNTIVLSRALDSLNACASISSEHKHSICTPWLLGYCAELLQSTRNGRLHSICCCLVATLADTQLGARYVSSLSLSGHLLSLGGDQELLGTCCQLLRWGHNLRDRLLLSCVRVPPDPSPLAPGHRRGLGQLREEHFVVDRMMGVIRQGCMNCEALQKPSCTQSDSLSSEEVCLYASSLSIGQYQQLVNRGWYRRGGDRMFRWGTKLRRGCVDWETRVRVKEFSLKQRKSFSRVMKRIPDSLTVDTVPARFTEEGYTLYNEYNLYKHDKSRVSKESYIEHVVDTCVPTVVSGVEGVTYGTFHQEYRVAGELIAIGVIDIIPEGVVSIYFYYKMCREVTRLSLGRYSSLREIQLTQRLGALSGEIRYYYIQG